MMEINLFHLVLRYPSIRLFVRDCYIRRDEDKLFNFLMDVEFHDPAKELYLV